MLTKAKAILIAHDYAMEHGWGWYPDQLSVTTTADYWLVSYSDGEIEGKTYSVVVAKKTGDIVETYYACGSVVEDKGP